MSRKKKTKFVTFENDVELIGFMDPTSKDGVPKKVGRIVFNNDNKKIRVEGDFEKSSLFFFDSLIRYFDMIDPELYKIIGPIKNEDSNIIDQHKNGE